MSWEVRCFDCGTVLGYTYCSAPMGIINCEDCHSKELERQAEREEEEDDE